ETSMRKTFVKGGSFVRYPFELQDLRNIELTNNKYLIGRTIHQRTGSWTLDFYLTNGNDGEGALNQVTMNVDHSQPKNGTLENLLIWVRNQKNDASLFLFAVTLRHYVLMVTQCYIFCSSSLPPLTVKLRLITSGPKKAGTTHPVGVINSRKVLIERLEASGVTHATILLSTRF
nr:hypothetical protein [Tanacetum cinerariifolium]